MSDTLVELSSADVAKFGDDALELLSSWVDAGWAENVQA